MSTQPPGIDGSTEPGFYLVPSHHRKEVVERRWDGELWTDQVRPASDEESLPRYRRHLFRFLKNPGWKLLLGFVVFGGIAAGLWTEDRDNDLVSGIQVVMPLFSGLAALCMMAGFLIFIGRRVGFDRITAETRTRILRWGILSGLTGIAFSVGVELGLPKLFGQSISHDHGWAALAGPAEETGKLLLPLVLWVKGYFRRPVEGYLLVLISACTFGVLEATEYGFQPEEYQLARPASEIMHPLFTGFVAAVAWPAAWRVGKMFTWTLFGAWLVAVLAHSINDVVVLDKSIGDVSQLTGFVTFAAIGVMYLLQKHVARQMVPPDRVGDLSPRWRPVAPRLGDQT